VLKHLEELDRRYPSALFILTTRGLEGWLASCQGHWERTEPTPINAWNRTNVYSRADFDELTFRRVYREHHARIQNYFADRPWQLLELDLVAGDGWEKLCQALALPVPGVPFPHEDGRPS
jgi:hypothetical protein